MRGGPGADRETGLRGVPAAGGVSGYYEIRGGVLPERVHGESRQNKLGFQTDERKALNMLENSVVQGFFRARAGGKFGFSGRSR